MRAPQEYPHIQHFQSHILPKTLSIHTPTTLRGLWKKWGFCGKNWALSQGVCNSTGLSNPSFHAKKSFPACPQYMDIQYPSHIFFQKPFNSYAYHAKRSLEKVGVLREKLGFGKGAHFNTQLPNPSFHAKKKLPRVPTIYGYTISQSHIFQKPFNSYAYHAKRSLEKVGFL